MSGRVAWRDVLEERRGGGVWDPKVCAQKMARPDFPNGKFRFAHDGPFGRGRGGGLHGACGVRPFSFFSGGMDASACAWACVAADDAAGANDLWAKIGAKKGSTINGTRSAENTIPNASARWSGS